MVSTGYSAIVGLKYLIEFFPMISHEFKSHVRNDREKGATDNYYNEKFGGH